MGQRDEESWGPGSIPRGGAPLIDPSLARPRGREAEAKKIQLIRGDTVATGPSEPCQQFNQCI